MGHTKELSAEIISKAQSGVRTITAIVTSGNADRDGDMVDVKSLRFPLKAGGYVLGKDLNGSQVLDLPFLLNHSFNVEDMIGGWQSGKYIAETDEIQLEAGVSTRDKAQDLMKLFDEGFVGNNFSITMSDYTYDAPYIYDAEVVECSFVFKGANRDAKLQMVKSLLKGEDMAEIAKKSVEERKAELQKELADLEAQDQTPVVDVKEEVKEETPVAEPVAVEAEETPVVEAEVVEEAKVEETEEAEAEVAEEEKTNDEEVTKMSEIKDTVSKQVKEVVEAEAEVVTTKSFDKVELMAKQFSAWVTKDATELEKLNKMALDTYKTKATYHNTGVTADGGAIVPSNEFLTDVFTQLDQYSSIANDLRVITLTEGNGLDIATLLTDVVVTEVGTEGGNKPVTKLVFGDGDISVREFAGIAIVTKKLVRQAAVNVYDILRDSFARAIANKRAELALTDATSGIINKAGITDVSTGAMPTWAEIKSMPYAVTVAASQGGKYYISRELLESLDGVVVEGVDQNYVSLSGDGLTGTFKNGYPFAVEEVLGSSSAHAVFGNAGRYGILLRQGVVENETFDTGIVTDGSDVDHNLLQQNKLANRVAFYENVGWPLPSAFAVTTNGTSS